jgi:hypothetical protein
MVTTTKVFLLLTRACWQLHMGVLNCELLKAPDTDFAMTRVQLQCCLVGLTANARFHRDL